MFCRFVPMPMSDLVVIAGVSLGNRCVVSHREREFRVGAFLVRLCAGVAVSLAAVCPVPAWGEESRFEALNPGAMVRDPVAVVRLGNSGRCVVAQRRSRTLAIVDLDAGSVAEFRFPGEPVDLVTDGESDTIWVADHAGRRVLEIGVDDRGPTFRRAIPVNSPPDRLAMAPAGHRLAVASLWHHAVSLVDLAADPPEVTRLELSFPPGEMLWFRSDRLLIADAFGGRMAVAALSPSGECRVMAQWELAAHNLRGLSLSDDGETVLLAHQTLHKEAPTTRESIESGRLIGNLVRTIPVAALLKVPFDPEQGTVTRLGNAEVGAADPAATCRLPSGRFLTLLAGSGELCLHDAQGTEFGRLPVGEGPVDWVSLPERNEIIVLNRFSQSLAVFDIASEKLVRTLPLGTLPPLSPADRGERLFFDSRLSHHGWLSCHSCHPRGHSSGDLADTLADDSYGTPKRVLSLLGTRDNNPWGWNGAFRELHTQVAQSVSSSMQGPPLLPPQVNDMVAYLHTLDAPPEISGDSTLAQREQGRQVFERQRCSRCHVPPLTYTSDGLFDVGLRDEKGLSKFNPPSLRGVRHMRRLFHDGRAESLRDVLVEEAHQLDESLPPEELEALMAFLRSL